MTAEIEIKPEVFKWAINTSGRNIEDIQSKFNKIKLNLDEPNQLTMIQLDKLSRELRIPFGYFMLNTPPEEHIELLKYRTINNEEHPQSSRELIDTIKDMQKKQSFMKETLLNDRFSPLAFIGSLDHQTDVKRAAEIIRNTLGLSLNWNYKEKHPYNRLKHIVSNAGILVMQNGIVGNNTKRMLDVSEFRAFVMIDEYVPLIFINAADSETGKLFSLCHELIHVWLGQNEIYNVDDNLDSNLADERYCNEVAAELILPEQYLIEYFNEHHEALEVFVEQMAYCYAVSPLVVLIRLKNLKLINYHDFDFLYKSYNKSMQEKLEIKKQQKGSSFYNVTLSRLDHRFLNTVDNKAKEGSLLYSEAYELVGVRGETYHHLMNKLEAKK